MQVELNLTPFKMPFKAYKNNKMMYCTPRSNQIHFGDSYNSHTRKSQFDNMIQKLGITKKQKDKTIIEVLEMNPNVWYNSANGDSDVIQLYSKMCNIDPLEALFITSYRDGYDCPVVVFNSFSSDVSGNEKMQLFVLESPHRDLTDTQKAAYKMFYDNNTRNLFTKGGLNNPLRKISKDDCAKKIKGIARGIQNPTWAKYCANAEQLDPVIFTTDGKQKYWFNPKNL